MSIDLVVSLVFTIMVDVMVVYCDVNGILKIKKIDKMLFFMLNLIVFTTISIDLM